MQRTSTVIRSTAKLAFALALVLVASSAAFADGKAFYNIDDITATDNGTVGWGTCSNCAGGQISNTFWMAHNQTTPSVDGASTELYMAGPAYSNVLFYNKLGPYDTATHFTWSFWVQVDSSSYSAQTFEFDAFQFVNGRRFMFGTQCNYSNGQWQIWSEGGGYWLNAGIACQKFTPGRWYHITWRFHRGTGTDTRMYYDTFTIQQGYGYGRTYYLNTSQPSGPLPYGWGDNLGVQFQLDLGPSGGELHEWIDQVSLNVY
ncbi:MAG: hypothetical protein JO187_00850 [Acidobacteria bacterium]|nr:hypothetical protein [Acidobacteriota bacterium]